MRQTIVYKYVFPYTFGLLSKNFTMMNQIGNVL